MKPSPPPVFAPLAWLEVAVPRTLSIPSEHCQPYKSMVLTREVSVSLLSDT